MKIPAIAVMYRFENQPSAARHTAMYVVRAAGTVLRTTAEPLARSFAEWAVWQGYTVRDADCSVRWVSAVEAVNRAF